MATANIVKIPLPKRQEKQPAPLVNPEVDSRKLMRLYFDRDAIISATEDACLDGDLTPVWQLRMAALAWRERNSLPNDDKKLARLICNNMDQWLSLRDELLSDWIVCSDGRLYNRAVADAINESWRQWKQRADASAKAKAARAAKKAESHATPLGNRDNLPAGQPTDGPVEVTSRPVQSSRDDYMVIKTHDWDDDGEPDAAF